MFCLAKKKYLQNSGFLFVNLRQIPSDCRGFWKSLRSAPHPGLPSGPRARRWAAKGDSETERNETDSKKIQLHFFRFVSFLRDGDSVSLCSVSLQKNDFRFVLVRKNNCIPFRSFSFRYCFVSFPFRFGKIWRVFRFTSFRFKPFLFESIPFRSFRSF